MELLANSFSMGRSAAGAIGVSEKKSDCNFSGTTFRM